jgi:hypothetical protein
MRSLLICAARVWLGAGPLAGALVEDDVAVWRFSLENPSLSVFALEVEDLEAPAGCLRGLGGHLQVREIFRTSRPSVGKYSFCLTLPPGFEPESHQALQSGGRYLTVDYVPLDNVKQRHLDLQPPLLLDSPEARQALAQLMVVDSPLMLPLCLGVLILPLVSVVSLVLAERHAAWPRLLRGLSLLAPPTAVGLYLWYESLVSPYYNIRIDLLLLWPALLVAALSWMVALLRLVRPARPRT